MQEQDFSKKQDFPGTTGNLFDLALHRAIAIQKIPAFFFALILFLLAFAIDQTRWALTTGLFAFFCLDWLLITSLPRANKSYGPSRPTVLILAVLRSLAALFPLFISLPLEGLGTLLVLYGFWIEPHRIRVTRVSFISPKLPAGQSFSVLHLGDLHLERITARERQLSSLIAELKPDLILFSGDFINLSYLRDPQAWREVREVIQDWQTPHGAYVVTGSPAVDLDDVMPTLLDGLPIHWLKNDKVTLDINGLPVNLFGLSCSHKPFVDGPQLKALAANREANFSILLYHSPDLAPITAQTGIDLQLSGHTHGGQVRLPLIGALFTGSLYGKAFEAGRMQLDQLTLYITRGIGMEGAAAPRVRFLCPPEIILWKISGPGQS